ncbi:N-6 DNA methylase [Psychrobacillus sp. NEAU-3TGS]|uniref:N-6 DNA methylase n=1 Tax=Psychrobacillus sp. NEAU-3TGS TaxID=2995412 RepID=UPI0024991020|nr:N-6 DNA methylase [Psychrobacillus sp. NEAU-3TGS]MDI2586601.1 N-6 DNA methylase [Psychrobacillus sp. NEAU-3TGS]
MSSWRELVENQLSEQKNIVAQIDLSKASVLYSKDIKHHRELKVLSGDEEIVRAYILDRLVNDLDYRAENIETEKEYNIHGGHSKLVPRIDVIVKDDFGNPFFFIELKSPSKFERDKSEIEGQLFALAQAEERDFKTKVKYLVYYTLDEVAGELLDKLLIIDFEKYPTYAEWEADGYISIGTKLTGGYGKPKKQPLLKGDKEYDLRLKIDKDEVDGLAKDLHNKLWGGGGTNDSEIFYSLVNIILAKIQDEYEKVNGEEYDFQVYQYGVNTESPKKLYERINDLYKRAKKEQLNISDEQQLNDDSVINLNKFQLNKLIYTVQTLENISFLEGRNSLNNKDILGDFFESITRDGFKQHKGQFFTPTPIVKFLLFGLQLDTLAIEKLNNERELPYIIDPSAGSGTYLVEAMRVITKELKYKQKYKLKSSRQLEKRFEELFTPDHNENKWAREYLYGSEINFDLGTASKVNMILHGDGSTNIFVKSGLLPFHLYRSSAPNVLENNSSTDSNYAKEINGRFDVVISNPPFSVDLDTETLRSVKNTFIFGEKKNSENLFIERYYQLLKEGGRLGVVLPESVFDTIENKYIRLFIYKYFNVKAVVSLPEVTFEPYTSTKTSILFAQKKSSKDITLWNDKWNEYGKEWGRLKTRINNYIDYFIYEKKINGKWAKDVVENLKGNNISIIKEHIDRYLKDFIIDSDKELDVKDLLVKYQEEIDEVSKIEKETDVFGFYNAAWVFGEVAKELDYNVFMGEASHVGYKRSKKGTEKVMPNDLYDLEFAPLKIEEESVLQELEDKLQKLVVKEKALQEFLENLKQNEIEKSSSNLAKQIVKQQNQLESVTAEVAYLQETISEVNEVFAKYYDDNGILREEYLERDDEELINKFKYGFLTLLKSEEIVLREQNRIKILDYIRQEVKWE